MKDISTSIAAYEHQLERDEKLQILENVSGYNVDELIRLFSAGWILTHPPVTNLEELAKLGTQDTQCHKLERSDDNQRRYHKPRTHELFEVPEGRN